MSEMQEFDVVLTERRVRRFNFTITAANEKEAFRQAVSDFGGMTEQARCDAVDDEDDEPLTATVQGSGDQYEFNSNEDDNDDPFDSGEEE